MKRTSALVILSCMFLLTAGALAADADHPEHTYFRKQSTTLPTDSSTNENIPGLAPVDVKAVDRAIPILEPIAPYLTLLAPLLPDFYKLFNAMGWYLPISWPLAGTGATGDWLKMIISAFTDAFLGKGPRPAQAPTLLVASSAAYAKFPHQVATYGDVKLPLDPLKLPSAAAAISDQITRNMMLPEAPLLASAPNGTIVKTMGGVTLILVVKGEDRYLVSNTTTSKLVKADIRFGPHTICIVDSFVVPKLSTSKPQPTPLMTDEERKHLPQILESYSRAFADIPQSLAETPVAWAKMVKDQLPDKAVKLLNSMPRPLKFSLNFVDQLPPAPKFSFKVVSP